MKRPATARPLPPDDSRKGAAPPVPHPRHSPLRHAPPHRDHGKGRLLHRLDAIVALVLFVVAIVWAFVLSQHLPNPIFQQLGSRAERLSGVVVTAGDLDHDGLPDALEDELLARYAPDALLSPDDPSKPASIEWLRARQELALDGPRLFGVLVPGRRFDAETRRGSPDPSDWVVYGHSFPRFDGGVVLQYWFYFPYNDGPFVFDHESDWEHVTVELGPDREPELFALARHGHNAPGKVIPWAEVPKEGDHPWFTIASGTHAAYLSKSEAPFWETVADCPRGADGRPRLEGCAAVAWRAGEGEGRSSPLVNVGERGAPRPEADGFFFDYPGLWGAAAVIGAGSAAPPGPPFQCGFCVRALAGTCH
jgi:hypothetical protein